MERSKAFQIAAEELDGFGGQFLGIIAELVVNQTPPNHVVGDSPDRSKPRRRIAGGAHIIHFFRAREGAYAERSIECPLISIVFAHDSFGLLRIRQAGPECEKSGPDSDPLDQAWPVAWHTLMQAEGSLGLERKEIEINAVEESIAFVPTVFLNGRAGVRILFIVLCNLAQIEATTEIAGGFSSLNMSAFR